MKKAFLLFVCLLAFVSFFFILKSVNKQEKLILNSPSPTQFLAKNIKQEKIGHITKKAIFIPYWTFGNEKIDTQDYNQLIYFGVSVNKEGIDKNDQGYKKLDQFMALSDSKKERLLAIRMTNSSLNSEVLRDKNLQKKIAEDSITIVQKYQFNGLVLDFELSGISFDSAIKQTSDFVNLFYSLAKKEDLFFSITLPGDTFYRFKPYDVPVLTKSADQIFVMAYDFYKARGNPGPNFPFKGRNIYGYDFTGMVDDFSKVVSKDKLTIVFGLFGYDWVIDSQKRSIEQGKALSFLKIKESFIDTCIYKNCLVRRDNDASETEITYQGKEGKNHVVWFEDISSIAKKEEYLLEKGINSVAFWAYSFF